MQSKRLKFTLKMRQNIFGGRCLPVPARGSFSAGAGRTMGLGEDAGMNITIPDTHSCREDLPWYFKKLGVDLVGLRHNLRSFDLCDR